ncbi:MAG: GNAT family N-acetyltransferase [Actinobacteria bacterium]|uniref:Unannotated protein n=1 Tax=freshwater metagenome TaxID=449393 RepID=A0A6J5Z6A2_9ZZZZ|nr:GNAT family N-acetyltransferase [Actinomycetota bacterium]
MSIVVREATPQDVSHMHDMILELAIYEKDPDAVVATEEDLLHALFGGTRHFESKAATPSGSPGVFAFVIDSPDGTGLAGMAIWMLNYSTWEGKHGVYLEDLYVREQFRGKGFGKALLVKLAQVCTDNGYTRFQWWVLDWNQPAIDVYRAMGAQPMDEWTVYRVSGPALTELSKTASDLD